MSTHAPVSLHSLLQERREIPSADAILAGTIPIVAKVRFADGGIELRPTTGTRTDLRLVRRGDLLVSGINALKGAIALVSNDAGTDMAATIHYSTYSIKEHLVLPAFLHAYMRSLAFRRIATAQLPNGIKTELKARRLLAITIPLPSLDEQRDCLKSLRSRYALVTAIRMRRAQVSEVILGRRVAIGADARRTLAARLAEMETYIRDRHSIGILEDVLVGRLRHGPSVPCTRDVAAIAILMPSSTTGFGLDTTKVMYTSHVDALRDGLPPVL